MKKIFSLAIATALLLTTMAVPASAETTVDSTGKRTIVSMMDFETVTEAPAEGTTSLTNAQLANMGITADIEGKADVTVVELDGNKVLKFDPNNTESTGAKLDIPLNYTLNNDEKLYVEFDWKYESDLTGTWDAVTKQVLDPFYGDIGTVGLVTMSIISGGNGPFYTIYGRNVIDYLPNAPMQDARYNTQMSEWLHTSQTYDKAAYEEDTTVTAQNGGAVIKTTEKEAEDGFLATERNIQKYPADGIVKELTFSNNSGMGCIYIDNITVYAIRKMTSTGMITRDGEITNKTAEVTFSNDIKNADSIAVTAGETLLEKGTDYTVEVSGNKATITFTDHLEYETTYYIDVNGVTDTYDQAVAGAAICEFTTKDAPDVYITDEITPTETLGVNGVAFTLKNSTNTEKDITALLVSYDENNRLVDTVITNLTLSGEADKTVKTGMELSGVKKIKTLIWDSLNILKPYMEVPYVQVIE